jgi:hypothetical protein
MAYGTSNMLGADVNTSWTPGAAGGYSSGQAAPFELGQVVESTDGGYWVYCLAGVGGFTGTGYAVIINPDTWVATMVSTANDVVGLPIGVPASGAVAAGDYVWVQRAGSAQIFVVAATAAATPLTTTATGGVLDDSGGQGITNAFLTTTRGGTNGLAPAFLNFPMQA